MARPISIRWSLLGSTASLIALLGGAILATTYIGEQRALRTLSRALIVQTIEQTIERLQRFFDPVTADVLLLRAWGEAGLLDPADAEGLNRLLVPVMRLHPQISALLVADPRGREHMLLRVDGAWRSRQTRRDAWGTRTRWLEWTDAEAVPVVSWRDIDYDPRTRPWYQGAVRQAAAAGAPRAGPASDLVHWTEPYPFFTLKDPGITASVAFNPGDGRDHVIGVDVLLAEISAYTTALRPSPNGAVAVLVDDDRLIGLPRDPRFADPAARLPALLERPGSLGLTVLADAMAALAGREAGEPGPLRFRSGGRSWWGDVRRFELGAARSLSVAVVAPESDLIGPIAAIRTWILLLTAASLGLAIVWAAALARHYSRPLEALVRDSGRISRGDLEPGDGVRSGVAEVQQLAEAHDRMRESLRTLLKMERDLQLARQIQQSTLPETLPIIDGFEIDAWSEPAEATGGDTFDVVGLGAGDGQVVPAGRAERAILLLADAAGHGIGPALAVTQVRAMLRMAARAGQDLPTLVRGMNAQLSADLRHGHFVTAWFGLLDGRHHTLTSVSCGQAPILHYRAAARDFAVLGADTVPLGVEEAIDPGAALATLLAPGDVVAVISDGVLEARSAARLSFGTGRAMAVIREHHRRSAADILTALRASIEAFTAGAPPDDDRTVVIVKRLD